MPCNCSGLRVDKCSCALVPYQRNEGVMVLAHARTNNQYCKPRLSSNIFVKVLENLYEKCAGYNLRYCPLRDLVSSKSLVSATLRDLLVLLCFLLANFVVLVAILAKITLHMSCALVRSAQWLKRLVLQEYERERRSNHDREQVDAT